MSKKEILLKIENLESWYGKLQILKGIDMEINKGELVAIIGPNGSGKSTTLKSIFGLVKNKKGKIIYNKQNLVSRKPSEIVKIGISIVPQGRRVFSTMTVEENLEIGGFILRNKEEVEKRIQQVYDYFPVLKEKKHQKATFLSGGQQQMLSIGRALMLNPDLLLLDEPSLGLSPKLMKEIFQKIKEINKKGTTIILVEQNAIAALEICDKAYILETGKVVLKDAKQVSKKQFQDVYFGG